MDKRDWLVSIRMQLGMTQEQVASKAGIERSTYSQYELGRRTPDVNNAKNVANALGFDWTIFFASQSRTKTQKINVS